MYQRNTDPKFWDSNYSKNNCNCGSFALNVTSWFSPYDNDDTNGEADYYSQEDRAQYIIDLYFDGLSREKILDKILELDRKEILRVCPWLEPVSEFNLPKDEERVIAYRLQLGDVWEHEVDTDFHFRVRLGGFWFEKCGEGPIRFCENQEITDPWETSPQLVYDSNILYFRMK